MNRSRVFLTGLAFTLVLFVGAPVAAQAASASFFGPIVSPECTCPGTASAPQAPGFGCLLQTMQNLINVGVSLSVIIAVLVIAYAGILFIFSATNPEAKSKAKGILANAAIGMVIVLSAWLIVDFVMKIVYEPNAVFSGQVIGPWNSIISGGTQCIVVDPKIQRLFDGPALGTAPGTGAGSAAAGGSPATVTGGKCAVQANGPCSVANLTPAFGTAATTFSKICSHESGGGAILNSTVDKTPEGQPVSFGLFQINISANTVGSYNCPSAFQCSSGKSPCPYTGSNHDVHIKDERLYEECKAAALDSATNIATAAALYKKANGFGPWLADKECGFQS